MNREEIEQTEKGKLEDIQGRRYLLISFGGFKQGLGIPVFEFFNSLSGLDCDKVFLRDFEQVWYHNGVDEELKSSNEIVAYLNDIIALNKYKKVCVLGNSMGGYAAMLFGYLIKADRVIAFVPQTFLNKTTRLLKNDRRVPELISKLYASDTKNKSYFDLKKLMKKNGPPKPEINMYYALDDRIDRAHAERMRAFENIIIHTVPTGGHGIVKDFRNSGELNTLIQKTFE